MKINGTVSVIFWFVALAVAAVAAGSFTLSFQALHALAVENGQPASLAWIWPLVVDVSVVIYTAAILVAQLQTRDARLAITLTIGYGIVTITGNILHAPPSPTGWFVAALPPVSVILGTEMIRVMLKHRISEAGLIASLADLIAERDAGRSQLDDLHAQIDQASERLDALKAAQMDHLHAKSANLNAANDARQRAIDERRAQVLALKEQDYATGDIADMLDVSPATIRRDLKALNGRIK